MHAQTIQITLHDEPVSVIVSEAARNRLQEIAVPLLCEMELYFSCLIKKVCHFCVTNNLENTNRVMDGLFLQFRSSMTNKCSISEFDVDSTTDFSIVNQQPYIPRWVKIDYSNGQWLGDFGYAGLVL